MILITGSRGFIGSMLMERLGEHAVGYDIADGLDLCDYDQLDKEVAKLSGLELIINCAGAVGEGASVDNPLLHWRANLLAPATLFDVALQHNIKVIHLSSSAAQNLDTPYAASKFAAEVAADHAVQRGADIVCFRLHNIYGPGQPLTHAVPAIMDKVAAGLAVFVGKNSRDYIYKDDVADIMLNIGPELTPGVYDLGTGHGTSDYQLALSIEQVLGKEASIVMREPTGRWSSRTAIVTDERLRGKTTLLDGLEKVWQSMREMA